MNFDNLIWKKWFSSLICEAKYKVAPQGSAFIETPSGTYQAVASIQGERSPAMIPAFCDEENPCPEKYLCQEGFCLDEEENILEVYVYKISWGVTAPRDEEFTPNKDEYGNAVNFNIKVGDNWLYERDGVRARTAIQLENGESDNDFRVYFSLKEDLGEVCIVWGDKAPETSVPSFIKIGGTEKLSDVCNSIVQSGLESVYWEGMGPAASRGSSKVSSGEVKPAGGYLE